jgi:rSAM/selenodomain-associated transferase 1
MIGEGRDGLREAVVLMAKAPVPGGVKTRLCPPLDPRGAARLYGCMLGDTAAELSAVSRVRRYLFLDSPEPADFLRRAPFSAFEPFPQRGKDLGERMRDAAATAFRLGATRVVIVGADCPSLSAGTVRSAFRELSSGASVVFGPSADGGYYLIGLSSPDERLFRGFRWGTAEVLRDAAARCRILSAPFSFLPAGRDVDTGEDLLALRDWAGSHARPACPRTRGWITGFFGPGGDGFPGPPGRTPGPPRGSRSRRGG